MSSGCVAWHVRIFLEWMPCFDQVVIEWRGECFHVYVSQVLIDAFRTLTVYRKATNDLRFPGLPAHVLEIHAGMADSRFMQ